MATTWFYQLEGWPSAPASNNNAHRFNADSGVWQPALLSPPPFSGQVVSTNSGVRQSGTWDGNYWYTLSPAGVLYRYNPNTDSWSGALASGAVLVPATIEDQSWCMASDGRFVYVYATGGSFRRYDPVGDTLSLLASPSFGGDGPRVFMCYDGTDTIYLYRGDTSGSWGKFSISGGGWTATAAGGGIASTTSLFAAFLQGKLWVLRVPSQATATAYSYTPGSDTWATLATVFAANGFDHCSPFHELTDSVIRVWSKDVPGVGTFTALDYNILSNTWANGPNPDFATNQGAGFTVGRTFNPTFTWFEEDGITLADPIEKVGALVVGEVAFFRLKVQTPVTRTGGATVSVPNQPGTDADDVVTVGPTPHGPFLSSFATGALVAGQFVDVWFRIAPTGFQTLGLNKTFVVKVAAT